VAGDGLLHPVPLAAIAILIVNDHILKAVAPGLLTGKLSDIAGLVFFPLLLQASWEVAVGVAGTNRLAERRVLVVAIAVTALLFCSIKVIPAANDLISRLLGVFGTAVISLDPTDLIALPALLVALRLGSQRSQALDE
jgi:hypothetical protein